MKRKLCWAGIGFALAIVLTGALISTAHAETVLVDFGNNDSFRGVSVPAPDSNGHYWNSIQPEIGRAHV